MTRLYFLAFLAPLSLPTLAFATEDPMALQRCIWSCLANSPGAESQQYANCVSERCEGMAETQSTDTPERGKKGNWSIYKLSKDEPPYLDGYAANSKTRDKKLGFSYVCGKSGDSYFSIAGQPINRLRLKQAQSKRVDLTIDNKPGYIATFSEYEGALVSTEVSKASEVLTHLKSGNRLTIDIGRYKGRLSLKGSSWALDIALNYCG